MTEQEKVKAIYNKHFKNLEGKVVEIGKGNGKKKVIVEGLEGETIKVKDLSNRKSKLTGLGWRAFFKYFT